MNFQRNALAITLVSIAITYTFICLAYAEFEVLCELNVGGRGYSDVAVDQDYIYLCSQEGFLEVFTRTEPLACVGFIDLRTDDEIDDMEIALDDDYAYITRGNAGIYIVDISQPSALKVVSWIGAQYADGCFIRDDHLFVCNEMLLSIFDVCDRSSPSLLSAIAFDYWTENVAVTGDYAYVVGSPAGLFIVDISDITEPVIVNHLFEYTGICSLQIEDGLAYLCTVIQPPIVLDIRDDPAYPQVLYHSTESVEEEHNELTYADGYVFIADEEGLKIYDATDPSNLDLILTEHEELSFSLSVAAGDGELFFSSKNSGYFRIFNYLTLPDALQELATYRNPSGILQIGLSEDYLVILDSTWQVSVSVYDISDPTMPVNLSRTELTESIHPYMSVDQGRVAIVTEDKLSLYQITAQGTLSETFSTTYYNYIPCCYLRRDYLIANHYWDETKNIDVFYVEDFSAPELVLQFKAAHGQVFLGYLNHDIYYILEPSLLNQHYLNIINVSDPSNILYKAINIGQLYPMYLLTDMMVNNQFLYIGTTYGGIQLYNLDDPMSPEYMNDIDVDLWVNEFALVGEDIYLVSGHTEGDNYGIYLMDLSQQGFPIVLTSQKGIYRYLEVKDDIAITGDEKHLHILRIPLPEPNIHIGGYLDTNLEAATGGKLRIFGLAPNGLKIIRDIRLLDSSYSPIGISLDNGYREFYIPPGMVPPGNYLLLLQAYDTMGRTSCPFPYLCVGE